MHKISSRFSIVFCLLLLYFSTNVNGAELVDSLKSLHFAMAGGTKNMSPSSNKSEPIENLNSYRIPILKGGSANAVIIVPDSTKGREWADTLNNALMTNAKVKLSVLTPMELIDETTWLVRNEYRGKNLILIGNTANNPALWEFYMRFYVGACPEYPGKDEFVVRTIFEPLVVDHHAMFIGGCDNTAISRAVNWVKDSLPRWKNGKDLQVPALIAGLKPKGRFKVVGSIYWGYLGRTAHRIWWDGDKESVAKAVREFRNLKPEDWGRTFGNAHYSAWPRFIGFQWLLSAGGFSLDEINKIKAEFPANWLGTVQRDVAMGRYSSTRHSMTDITAKWMVGKWILGHCPVNDKQREDIEKIVSGREKIIKGWCEELYLHGDPHLDPLPSRAQLNPHVALIGAWLGDKQFAKSGAAKMAGYQISSFYKFGKSIFELAAGIAAQLGQNPEMDWFIRNLSKGRFRPALCFGPLNAGFWYLNGNLKEQFPENYQGLYVQGANHRVFKHLTGKSDYGMSKNELPFEKCFDFAVFREGFKGEKEYLSLIGLNRQIYFQPLYLNSIRKYADLGEIFLQDWRGGAYYACGNPMRLGNKRSERMQVQVASVDEEKPSVYADLVSKMNFPESAAMTSRDSALNGTIWDRTIFWRRGRYFVVHDNMEAKKAGNYNFTCRWRSPHQSELNGRKWGGTVRGKSFSVIGAKKYPATARCWSPGRYKTYELLQELKRKKLNTGESITFGNLLCSRSEKVKRNFNICQPKSNLLMVKGSCGTIRETSMMGVNVKGELVPNLLSADAELVMVTPEAICFGGLKSYKLNGKQESFDKAQQMRIPLNGELKEKVSLELQKIWNNTIEDPYEDLPSFEPIWEISGLKPDKSETNDFKILSKHFSKDGETLDLTLDFGTERPIENISFGMKYGRDKPYPFAPCELVFAASTDPNYKFAKNYRKEPSIVNSKFFFFRLPGLDYMPVLYRSYNYGGNMPAFRIALNKKTRYLKIRVYKTEKSPKPFPKWSLRKIFVTEKRTPGDYLVRLNSGDLDGDGSDELITIGGRSNLAIFDSMGKKLWSDKPGIARNIDATNKQVLKDYTNKPDPPEELERFRKAGEIEVLDWIMLAKPMDLRTWDEVKAKPIGPKSILVAGSGEWLKLYGPDGSTKWFNDYLATANDHEQENIKIGHRDSVRLPAGAVAVYPKALNGEPQIWLATWCNYTYFFNKHGKLLENIKQRMLFVNQPVVEHDLNGDGKPDVARFTMNGFEIGEIKREALPLRRDVLMGPVFKYAFAEFPVGARKCVFVSPFEIGLLDFPTFKDAKRLWQKDFKSEISCADFIWGKEPSMIIGKQNGLLIKYDMKTGERLNYINLGESIVETACLSEGDKTIIFCVTPSYIYKLDADLKPLARRMEAHFSRIWHRPALFERFNYLRKLTGKDASKFIAVSGKDGRIRAYKP